MSEIVQQPKRGIVSVDEILKLQSPGQEEVFQFLDPFGKYHQFPTVLYEPNQKREPKIDNDNKKQDIIVTTNIVSQSKSTGKVEQAISQYIENTSTNNAIQCSICLLDYEKGDVINILMCRHQFHDECIERWVASNPTCPICQTIYEDSYQTVYNNDDNDGYQQGD